MRLNLGVGYVPPAEKSTTPTRNIRRGPFVMPSAPFKSASTATRIAMTPATQQQRSATTSTRFGSMSNLNTQKDE
jgi:hypothetical protein